RLGVTATTSNCRRRFEPERSGILMNSTFYKYSSVRAAKSRLGVRLNTMWQAILILLIGLLVIGGIAVLFVLHSSWGWLLIGLTAMPFMLYAWHRGDLTQPPVTTNSVDGLLAGDILGQLTR